MFNYFLEGWRKMKKIRRKVISADYVRGSTSNFWELYFDCGHEGYSGGFTKCPKTSICEECTEKYHSKKGVRNEKAMGTAGGL